MSPCMFFSLGLHYVIQPNFDSVQVGHRFLCAARHDGSMFICDAFVYVVEKVNVEQSRSCIECFQNTVVVSSREQVHIRANTTHQAFTYLHKVSFLNHILVARCIQEGCALTYLQLLPWTFCERDCCHKRNPISKSPCAFA
jgi:hypothetical protein